MSFYKELLEGLEKEGFDRSEEGYLKKEQDIVDELKFTFSYSKKEEIVVMVATDKNFAVHYIVDKNNERSHFTLETTYSNQPIDKEWLDRANRILKLINNK